MDNNKIENSEKKIERRGRKKIILPEEDINLILDYRSLGLSYDNIKKALIQRHDKRYTIYKIQQTILNH